MSIYAPQPHQRHTGLLYRDEQGVFRVVHLAFHFDLRDEEIAGAATCARASLSHSNQEIVAAFASQVVRGDPQIKYGVTSDGQCFDSVGNYIEGPIGTGLTCATFVTAIFRALQLPILAEESWPTRSEDKEWFEGIVKFMEEKREEYGIDQAHIDALKQDPVASRIRPEEVAAGALHADWPNAFQDIEALAQEVLEELGVAA